MKRSNKKGFTIVELVIVIAVIAILAAVLIPTIASLVKKANASADTQLVRDLNTAIAVYVNDALEGDEATMADALAAAAEFGYDIAKINAQADGNEILWDSVNNKFCYFNEGAVEYVPEFPGKKPVDDNAKYWVIDDEVSETYSTYLYGCTKTEVVAIHDLDVGDCGIAKVTYDKAGEVTIITNGGELVVDNVDATVKHYGSAVKVNVNKADTASYHEFGEVESLVIADGHLVIEPQGAVGTLVVDGENDNVTVDVVAESLVKTLVVNNTAAKVAVAEKAELKAVIGTASENITLPESAPEMEQKTTVANADQFAAALAAGKKYIELANDITVGTTLVAGIQDPGLTIVEDVIIDGAGKTVKFTDTRGFKIATSDIDVSIKNLKIEGKKGTTNRGVQVNTYKVGVRLTLDKVDITGVTYAINMCDNASTMTVNAINCKLSGWAALNIWGNNNKFTIVDCELTGTNDAPEAPSNGFSVIVIESDTTKDTDKNASHNVVNMFGGKITAVETNNNKQSVVCFNTGIIGSFESCVTFSNVEIVEAANGGLVIADGTSGNSVIKDGETVFSN